MLDFGEGFCVYKPAIDTKTVAPMLGRYPNGEKELVLNWLTPHQSGASTAPTRTTCAC